MTLPVKIVFLLLLAIPTRMAFAGITIHFEGKAKDGVSLPSLLATACDDALKKGWQCDAIAGDQIQKMDSVTAKILVDLQRSKDLTGAKGVVIHMHDMAEPLYLIFAANLKAANFVKTQFAGAAVHIQVIELFDKIKPFFLSLSVNDEGGYWDHRDPKRLENEIEALNAGLRDLSRKNPGAHGPVKRPDGRILDLVR